MIQATFIAYFFSKLKNVRFSVTKFELRFRRPIFSGSFFHTKNHDRNGLDGPKIDYNSITK